MNRSEIAETQRRIGVEADGFWGPKSIAACQKHLRGLMPAPNPWPGTDQKSLTAFYGAAGDENRLVSLPVAGYGLRYDGTKLKTIRIHGKCAESFGRILAGLAGQCPEILDCFDGCFNNRAMRGGSLPSLHARGAAVDFRSGSNGNRTSWPVAATMPLRVMEIFAREGWLAAGAFWGRDAMHFQATR